MTVAEGRGVGIKGGVKGEGRTKELGVERHGR